MGLIQLIVLIIVLWVIIGGILWIAPAVPEVGKRIIIAVGVLISLFAVLAAFGLLPVEGLRVH